MGVAMVLRDDWTDKYRTLNGFNLNTQPFQVIVNCDCKSQISSQFSVIVFVCWCFLFFFHIDGE